MLIFTNIYLFIYRLSTDSTQDTANTNAGSKSIILEEKRQLVGFNDDILDMKFIPCLAENKQLFDHSNLQLSLNKNESTTVTTTTTTGSTNVDSFYSKYALGLITNSNQVRIMDSNFNVLSMNGHTDIVLAIDVTPDG